MAGPDEVVRHPGWVEALAAVQAGLEAGSPVVLAGLPGLGKSLLLKALADILVERGQRVVLLPGDRLAQSRRPDVILLDEAERVPVALLRHLLDGAPRCVLAGSRALLHTLLELDISPRLVEMRPLRPGEVGPYLLEQIERAGLPETLLGPGTFEAIARLSHGNPRRLQTLASRALFRAWIDNADQVSVSHVADALAQDGPAAALAAIGLLPEARPVPAEPVAEAAVVVLPAPMLPDPAPVPVPSAPATRIAFRRLGSWMAVSAVLCVAVTGAVVVLRQDGPVPVAPPVFTPPPPPAGPAASVPGLPPPTEAMPELRLDAANSPAPAGVLPEPPDGVVAAPPEETASSVPPPAAPVDVPAPEPAPAAPEPSAPPLRPAPLLTHPASVPVHVMVSFAPSDAVASSRGVSLVGTLREAGLDAVLVIGTGPEGSTAVRYFFPADQAAASQVARYMGEPGRERLATFPGTSPRPGTVVVVISSRPAGHRPANANKSPEEKNS